MGATNKDIILIIVVNDKDKDGFEDTLDAFPTDPTQWLDSDGDNYGDNINGTNPDYYPNNPAKWNKEEESTESKKGDKLTLFIVGAVIIIIIFVLILFFLFLKFRKKPDKTEIEENVEKDNQNNGQEFDNNPDTVKYKYHQ
jgi:hypothetical protein